MTKHYEKGKADLYAAFLERGLELAKPGGISALLTMRGWMFLGQFADLRKHLLRFFRLRTVADLDSGAFEDVSAAQVVLSVAASVFIRVASVGSATALRPTPPEDRTSSGMTNRKRAGLLAQVGRYEFDPRSFAVIEGEPLVYWWSQEFLNQYAAAPKLADVSQARKGLCTGDDSRFTRLWWEVALTDCSISLTQEGTQCPDKNWVPTVKGGKGRAWVEPLVDLLEYRGRGLQVRVYDTVSVGSAIRNPSWYFVPGVAFTMIGNGFSARAHRYLTDPLKFFRRDIGYSRARSFEVLAC